MKYRYMLILIMLFGFTIQFDAQINGHGDVLNRARNVHAGNLIRATFHNNGRLGGVKGDQSTVYGGEWPIGSGKVQMGNTSAYVMTELRLFSGLDPISGDSTYEFVTPVIFAEGWDPNAFSSDTLGRFQGFEPLEGYLNLTQKVADPNHAVAMSHQAFTWPPNWPDKREDIDDPGWSGSWNGYFGKDQKNADEESYFVMDDYQFDKPQRGIELPLPIADDPMRGGLGLRVKVRGLQWSNPDAQDCIFWLYEIRNIGELKLDKTLFGLNVGASSGATVNENTDYNDDNAKFYREISLAVNFDNDNIGTGGYSPVPYVGFAFLESPGNAIDGIDNDGDGANIEIPGGGTGIILKEEDFVKFYSAGENIILIDYQSENYERTISQMPAGGITIEHRGRKYSMKPNTPLIEIERNGFDDNLNGIIDEADGAFTQDSVRFNLYIRSDANDQDYLAVDYFTGDGLGNSMIDERRDDGIDNDNDWNSEIDDVGLDGKPGTSDTGEGDGQPTPGVGDLPGEPNIDAVDVDESDQIGLTSFKFYQYGALSYKTDPQMWEFSRPGYFDNTTTEVADHDYVFTSGYFPLKPSQDEFFSIAMIYGEDETDIIRNKEIVQRIYNSNYNFAIAPEKPKVTAVAGDGVVTLYWNSDSELSRDRFLAQQENTNPFDFEGYKIYKASHHTFGDAGSITDGLGYERFKQPIAIYDKVDSVFGFFPNDFGTGVLFNLGNESGLVHKYVDNDVVNGVRYFYAVTAYDKGSEELNIGPSETTIFINVKQNGEIQFAENVVAVRPEAPALGFEEAKFDILPQAVGDLLTSGIVGVNIVDPTVVGDDQYEISFVDQSMDRIDNDNDGLIDLDDEDELIPTITTGFVLKNISTGYDYDTSWIYEYQEVNDSLILIKDLYQDADGDPRTFSQLLDGLEIFVKNPTFGRINAPSLGIYDGIKLSNSIELSNSYKLKFDRFQLGGFVPGTSYPRQYKIVFFNEIINSSKQIGIPLAANGNLIPLPARSCNFRVYDANTNEELEFGYVDASVNPSITPPGFYSAKDNIIMFEDLPNDTRLITYSILNNDVQDTVFFNANNRIMGEGDTLYLYPELPFNNSVTYKFSLVGQRINQETAKADLNKIKVVPNPYVITAIWEPQNPYTTGRGTREIHFIHLPERCTIRIYAIDGTLVKTLEHDSHISNGTEPWDLMTKDNMEVAYGVYVFHVDAPGVGEHVGKFLLIK